MITKFSFEFIFSLPVPTTGRVGVEAAFFGDATPLTGEVGGRLTSRCSICSSRICNSLEFEEAEKAVRERTDKFINNNGTKSVDFFHKRLGKIMWNEVGMARNEKGLKQAIADIQALREEFYADVRVLGSANGMNPELDKAGRVADLIELGELMAKDALERKESCGGHFREEYQSEEGEALRDDENFTFVSAWEFTGVPAEAKLHKEELTFENVELKTRSYK